MLTFDFNTLSEALAELPDSNAVIFACACTSRIERHFRSFAERTKRADPNLVRNALSCVAAGWVGQEVKKAELKRYVVLCDRVTPEEEPWNYIEGAAIFEDAAQIAAYTCEAALQQDPALAAIVGNRLYEISDRVIIHLCDINLNEQGSNEIIQRHPVMQRELERQRRDLAALSADFETESQRRDYLDGRSAEHLIDTAEIPF